MRKTLAIREGERLPDGRTLQEGSLYVDSTESDDIPITWANDNNMTTAIGRAFNMERKLDTLRTDKVEISFEMIMNDPDFDLDLFDVYVFATDIKEKILDTGNNNRLVERARIRTLQLVGIPGIRFGGNAS